MPALRLRAVEMSLMQSRWRSDRTNADMENLNLSVCSNRLLGFDRRTCLQDLLPSVCCTRRGSECALKFVAGDSPLARCSTSSMRACLIA
jgi:hypothetical protein